MVLCPQFDDRAGGDRSFEDKFGDHFRFYRLFFNTVALATFCPLALYSFQLKEMSIFVWDGALVLVQYALLSLERLFISCRSQALQLLLLFWPCTNPGGRIHSHSFSTSCFRDLWHPWCHTPPWYAGALLLIWARDFGLMTLIIILYSVCIWLSGAFLEERKLLKEFGDDYRLTKTGSLCFFPGNGSRRNCICRYEYINQNFQNGLNQHDALVRLRHIDV